MRRKLLLFDLQSECSLSISLCIYTFLEIVSNLVYIFSILLCNNYKVSVFALTLESIFVTLKLNVSFLVFLSSFYQQRLIFASFFALIVTSFSLLPYASNNKSPLFYIAYNMIINILLYISYV